MTDAVYLPSINVKTSDKQVLMNRFQYTGELAAIRATNSVGLYDQSPKYARQNNEPYSVEDVAESIRVKNFNFESVDYVLEITAARLKDDDGQVRYYFPSSNEELVEDILRHQTTINSQTAFWEDNYGCEFSLHFIWKELRRFNKSRNKIEIRQSLRILSRALLMFYRKDTYKDGTGDPIYSGTYLSESTVLKLSDYYKRVDLPEEAQLLGRAKFHNMVTESIKNVDYRLNRYDIFMEYRNDMSRWFHKRISHMHIGADLETPYQIKASTCFNDGNWKWQARLDRCKRRIDAALKEMSERGMIDSERTTVERLHEQNKHVDYVVTVYLSKAFIDHIILSNIVQKKNREVVQKLAASPMSENRKLDKANQGIIELMLSEGVEEAKIQAWIAKYSYEHMIYAARYTCERMSSKKQKNKDHNFDFTAYCDKALQNNWYNVPESEIIQEAVEINPENYTGMLKEFVIKHVVDKPDYVKQGFLQNGVNQGDLYDIWLKFSEGYSL